MKLTDKIHLLKIDFEIAISPDKKLPRFVNVILIFGDKITLIDSGVKGSEFIISEYIRQNKRDFTEIETLILSHSHPDHIGSAAKIKELIGCKIWAHEAEKEWIEDIEIQNRQRPVPGFFNLVDHSVKIDEFISDGQEMTIKDGPTLKFIHSPGHSKGSVNIEFVEDRILFTADSIPLKNDIPNYDNFSDLMNSLDKISKAGYSTLLSSWTPPLMDYKEIGQLIEEGKTYMQTIDSAVKECYGNTSNPESCKIAVGRLGLPPFLANPIVDKAFRSHLN
jgi:glyoxylase-like metal-dependent hydrolase (beta-lactamase superfamily II)